MPDFRYKKRKKVIRKTSSFLHKSAKLWAADALQVEPRPLGRTRGRRVAAPVFNFHLSFRPRPVTLVFGTELDVVQHVPQRLVRVKERAQQLLPRTNVSSYGGTAGGLFRANKGVGAAVLYELYFNLYRTSPHKNLPAPPELAETPPKGPIGLWAFARFPLTGHWAPPIPTLSQLPARVRAVPVWHSRVFETRTAVPPSMPIDY